MPTMNSLTDDGKCAFPPADDSGDSSSLLSTSESNMNIRSAKCEYVSLSDGESGVVTDEMHRLCGDASIPNQLSPKENISKPTFYIGEEELGLLATGSYRSSNSTIHESDGREIVQCDVCGRRTCGRPSASQVDVAQKCCKRCMKSNAEGQNSSYGLFKQLRRSFKFNSSGRSLNSEISLQNLNCKVESLRRHVSDLANIQSISESSSRIKTEYAVLQARYDNLEKRYHATDLRSQQRLDEEREYHSDMLAHVKREADLLKESFDMQMRIKDIELNALRDEAESLRKLRDKQAADLENAEKRLKETEEKISKMQADLDEVTQSEHRYREEKKSVDKFTLDVRRELECLCTKFDKDLPSASTVAKELQELQQVVDVLKYKNQILSDKNKELQTAVLSSGCGEGCCLPKDTAALQPPQQPPDFAVLNELKKNLEEKEFENSRLKLYIGNILVNILEKYPQLLELNVVEPNPMQSGITKN